MLLKCMILGYNISNFYVKESFNMDKYVCEICGYVYDPEVGDPENGVAPGTSFDDLSEEWLCPVCGATKENFSAVQ
jgi:rubredoxin